MTWIGPMTVLVLALLLGGCQVINWRKRVADALLLLGHRNWVVVADAAYPAQCRAGIDTVATGADQLKVLRAVLEALDAAQHVRPTIYLDAELQHVPEQHAPGIDAYRAALAKLLGDRPVTSIPHEDIIAKLDEAGQMFRILMLKTKLTLPYTSVFIRLDCGYWSAEAEKTLRAAIKAAG